MRKRSMTGNHGGRVLSSMEMSDQGELANVFGRENLSCLLDCLTWSDRSTGSAAGDGGQSTFILKGTSFLPIERACEPILVINMCCSVSFYFGWGRRLLRGRYLCEGPLDCWTR